MSYFSSNSALLFSVIILFFTAYTSYRGFQDFRFFSKYLFRIDDILISGEYVRLFSSGFLHANWLHLIFNMYTFFSFAEALESEMGSFEFLLIYFSSMLGGSLLSLFIHRNHGDYSAIGASGAVCGLIFAAIALYPGLTLKPILFPIEIPVWLYGLFFVLISVWGIKSQSGNIGHDAHLGGALIGMFVAVILEPRALTYNYLPIITIALPSLIFIFLILFNPEILITGKYFRTVEYMSKDEEFNLKKYNKQKDVDRILDKINEKGINSLTNKEKELLDNFSQ